MPDHPLVSIVTPTLNQGLFIEQTILSIRSQTYGNFEHLVIDGGSADDTLAILRRHEPAYRLRWISEPDRGMYDAINKGLAMAKGEILAYINSDDLYFPWTVELAARALAADPSAGLVYGDALRFDEPNGQLAPAFQAPLAPASLAAFGSLIQPTVFWRRDLSEAIGPFNADLRYVGDLEYWLRATRRFGAIQVDEIMAVDRVHPDAQSSKQAAALALEGAAMRRPFRRGLSGTGVGSHAAQIRAAVWARIRAERFARASRRHDPAGPWGSFIAACGPRIAPLEDRLRRAMQRSSQLDSLTWEHDPIGIAAPAPRG
jgi:glycosyltransferase involved in cell wall biosynthesis